MKKEEKRKKMNLDELSRVLEEKPYSAELFFQRGELYKDAGRYEEAIADYSQAIDLDCRKYSFEQLEDNCHAKIFYCREIMEFTHLIEENPTDIMSYKCRAFFYWRIERSVEAILDYNKVIEINPQDTEAYICRGWIYSCSGNSDLAVEDCNRAIALEPEEANFYACRGWIYSCFGNSDLAVEDYNRAIALEPEKPGFYYLLRGICEGPQNHRYTSDILRAKSELCPGFSNILNLSRSSLIKFDYNKTHQPHYKEISVIRELSDEMSSSLVFTNDLDIVSHAIELNPDHIEGYRVRANIYRELENYDAALSDYVKYLELNPDDILVYEEMGDVYRCLDKYTQAISKYTHVLVSGKKSMELFKKRAKLYSLLNLYSEALADYSQAIDLATKDDEVAEILFTKALLYAQSERYEEAFVDASKAHKILLNFKEGIDVKLPSPGVGVELRGRIENLIVFLYYKRLLCQGKIQEIEKLPFDGMPAITAMLIALDYASTHDDDSSEKILSYIPKGTFNSYATFRVYFAESQAINAYGAELATLYGVSNVMQVLGKLTSKFTLKQWIFFLDKWICEEDFVAWRKDDGLSEYTEAFDEGVRKIAEIKKTDLTPQTLITIFSNNIIHFHKRYFGFNLISSCINFPLEVVTLQVKLSVLKYLMDNYCAVLPFDFENTTESAHEDNNRSVKARQMACIFDFYHLINNTLQGKITDLMVKAEREKVEREAAAREEERNKVIQDLSHSIKNTIASVVDPLNELAEKYTDQRVTFQKALRGATLIRETVNALNLSYRGCLDDFIRDASEAAQHPDGKPDLKHLLEVALECAVNNMFDGKYFADFTHLYFPTREIFNEAEPVWQSAKQGGVDEMTGFISRYMFDYRTCYPENISSFKLSDRHNSPLKFTILFQELLLNAVKYACFAEREQRFVSIKVASEKEFLILEISNSYVPGKSARTTRIGNEIVGNFVKLLEGKLDVEKTGATYTVTLRFPNIFGHGSE